MPIIRQPLLFTRKMGKNEDTAVKLKCDEQIYLAARKIAESDKTCRYIFFYFFSVHNANLRHFSQNNPEDPFRTEWYVLPLQSMNGSEERAILIQPLYLTPIRGYYNTDNNAHY